MPGESALASVRGIIRCRGKQRHTNLREMFSLQRSGESTSPIIVRGWTRVQGINVSNCPGDDQSPSYSAINVTWCPGDDQNAQMFGESTSPSVRKMITVSRCQGNQHQQMFRRRSGSPDVEGMKDQGMLTRDLGWQSAPRARAVVWWTVTSACANAIPLTKSPGKPNKSPGNVQSPQSDVREISPKQVSR